MKQAPSYWKICQREFFYLGPWLIGFCAMMICGGIGSPTLFVFGVGVLSILLASFFEYKHEKKYYYESFYDHL